MGEHRKIETFKALPDEERLALFAEEDAKRVPELRAGDVAGKMGSYISQHPTSFNFASPVKSLVEEIQDLFPWLTYLNSYFWHPPYDPPSITVRYDPWSFDAWGGGLYRGDYTGYRGKPLPDYLHEKIFNYVFYKQSRPIDWVCTNGWLWTHYGGWSRYDPYDPYDADMGHYRHLHFTME